jgi:hypothetical protein
MGVLLTLTAMGLSGCSYFGPKHATEGTYVSSDGAEITLAPDGTGVVSNLPIRLTSIDGADPITGPISWVEVQQSGGQVAVLLSGREGVEPANFERYGLTASYDGGKSPSLYFYEGDPDMAPIYRLTLSQEDQ